MRHLSSSFAFAKEFFSYLIVNMASTDSGKESAGHSIPKECKAAVVHNIGPDFELKVEMVPVPEPGAKSPPSKKCS